MLSEHGWDFFFVAQNKCRCFPALLYPLPVQLRAWVTPSEIPNCLESMFVHLFVQIRTWIHVSHMLRQKSVVFWQGDVCAAQAI